MVDKKRTNIELTPDDEACLEVIRRALGATSNIGAIRYALRQTAEGLELDAARLAQARATATRMIPLDEFVKELEE